VTNYVLVVIKWASLARGVTMEERRREIKRNNVAYEVGSISFTWSLSWFEKLQKKFQMQRGTI
jgi:hypothetical protein